MFKHLKISGLLLLSILSFSCSTEEPTVSTKSTVQNESDINFPASFREYSLSRKGLNATKADTEASSKMTEAVLKYLSSIGVPQSVIDEKTREDNQALINFAIDEFINRTSTDLKN